MAHTLFLVYLDHKKHKLSKLFFNHNNILCTYFFIILSTSLLYFVRMHFFLALQGTVTIAQRSLGAGPSVFFKFSHYSKKC